MDFSSFAADVGVAFGLGVVIGFERELRNHEAGLRTNALVALGAGLFVSLSRWTVAEGDPTRIAGQVVTGVGFLAGGVIIRDGFSIRGLNTAGTLWCTAAIGTLAGSGFPLAAAFGAAVVLLLHIVLRPVANLFDAWVRRHALGAAEYRLKFTVADGHAIALRSAIIAELEQEPGVSLKGLRTDASLQPGTQSLTADATASGDRPIERITSTLAQMSGVSAAGWERHGA
jgi:putative Mg2+ transporter-C (MgtC) family protein